MATSPESAPAASTLPTARLPLIDALKALASQLVLLHHFSAYGPLSQAFEGFAPQLQAWLYDYGRIAVQVFLVVAGFLAARSLAPGARPVAFNPLQVIAKRYLRLAPPFAAALLLAVACSALARHWLDDDAIPASPTLLQFLAHSFLVQGILEFDALSAGVWYVTIDFQLFVLFALVLWSGRKFGSARLNLAPFLVALLALASLLYFNRLASWDDWGIYFFGSYALGAVSYWVSDRCRPAFLLGVLWAFGIFALALDFRLRIAVALTVALGLGASRRLGLFHRWPDFRLMEYLGRISFSVFLVHFPIYLLMNAFYERFGYDSQTLALVAIVAAWSCSIFAGQIFHHCVDSRPTSFWATLVFEAKATLAVRLGFR